MVNCTYNTLTQSRELAVPRNKYQSYNIYVNIGMFSLFFRCIQKWMKTDAQTV